jgi:hypothetical protein
VPWSHCSTSIPDSENACPECGTSKAKWTMRLEKTRTFALATKWSGDPEVQAAALQNAAENGTPFCEKCDQAKRELEAQEAEGSGTDGPAA